MAAVTEDAGSLLPEPTETRLPLLPPPSSTIPSGILSPEEIGARAACCCRNPSSRHLGLSLLPPPQHPFFILDINMSSS